MPQTPPELDELIRRSEETDLKALLRTKELAKQAMMEEPTDANIRAFERAAEALKRLLAARGERPAEAEPDVPAGRTFKTAGQVARYLAEQGWKVARRTVYKHVREGRLAQGPDGLFHQAAVDNYAQAHLERLGPMHDPDTADELEALRKAKLRAEKEKTEAQARHWELRTKIESGYYVKRSEVETALAARAQVLRSGYEDFVHAEAENLVKLVGGDPERTADLIEYMLEAGEEWFDRYAQDREFVAYLTGADAAAVDDDAAFDG